MHKLFYFFVFYFSFFLFINSVQAQEYNWHQVHNLTGITSLETTDWGLAIGEYDTRLNLNPYNGVYISRDLEPNWQQFGLAQRGVINLKYYENKLYATTFYHVNGSNGLFFSPDRGYSWTHLGNNFSTNIVDRNYSVIFLGTFSHGLWTSPDEGITWSQKIGTGFFGPKIESIKVSEDIALASTSSKTYISKNNGQTWQEVTPLSNKSIKSLYVSSNLLFAGTSSLDGLYSSIDAGTTWKKIIFFNNKSIGSITEVNNKIYAATTDSSNKSDVYVSNDYGITWQNTNLNFINANSKPIDISWTYSDTDNLFVAIGNQGIYKTDLAKEAVATFSFLDTPWDIKPNESITYKISSLFDHEYPLLGYSYYPEPNQATNTTMSFLGEREPKPYVYYSSHNGIDFALPYGTPVKAAASGSASYYYCNACGNTILINHNNSYQTAYMHLQSAGLITIGAAVNVNKGDTIGYVGMTGNTTGPHLHFAVNKDLDNDNIFSDNEPDGRVDPFGWVSENKIDPWETFSWTDTKGQHNGTKSLYLWNQPINRKTNFIGGGSITQLEQGDTTIDITTNETSSPFTITTQPGTQPKLPITQVNLKHVGNTSLLINVTSPTGKELAEIDGTVKLTFDLSDADLKNISWETLKVYFWDKVKSLWEPLTSLFNDEDKTLTAETNHFSHFAVFGQKIDAQAPITTILAEGTKINEWFTNYPSISFSTTDVDSEEIEKIFYSLDSGSNWEEYKQPFTLSKNGVINVQFRSQDIEGNLEETKNQLIRVDTVGIWKNQLIIKGARFQF